ncbi:HAD-IA family hydrolase [Nitriliruptoria bacterium AS10]|nr:HAD-IA family hydrolase [Salsipaludibacter albus]
MRHLPPHDDVVGGLVALRADGHRLVAFSNSSTEALAAQLGHAGLDEHLDLVVSVDGGGRFKPAEAAYVHLCRELDAFADEVTLVAAHDWDVAGARAAGLQGVLLARRPDRWHLPGPPDPVVSTVAAVAHVLDVA